jgi:hypothetical protein
LGAARRIAALAAEQGLRAPRIAIVAGDALTTPEQHAHLRTAFGAMFDDIDLVSANAYLGAEQIADALRAGADIVVAGRVADPSLTVGPAMAHFGWASDNWPRLGQATIAGHLLECGTQVTGGYFAIPGLKDVPGLENTGFPLCTLYEDGTFDIFKPPHTGGRVDARITKEQ